MAKSSSTRRKATRTKKEQLDAAIAEAVGAGNDLHLESVDFSDPKRPKTCLEVDFPILPINRVAAIEGNAGKPIYQMSKWWARRRSSVFRAMLIAAATKAPHDECEAARLVWESYYGRHNKNEAFRALKVADVFMGGGTTIVEGTRLGMQLYGNDLNPVAWFVVRNALANVTSDKVQAILDRIEATVKPRLMPFYTCDCPRGHRGRWRHRRTRELMSADFNLLALTPDARVDYEYEGPEVIYTFWCKHGPCMRTECGHLTPIMSSPVIAVKTLTIKAWKDRQCQSCGATYDLEQKAVRMAPAAMHVVAPGETPFATMDAEGNYACPQCGHKERDEAAAVLGASDRCGGKATTKKVEATLLVHPEWLRGAPAKAPDGTRFGGSVTDDVASTAAWNAERAKTLKLIEVRGTLPDHIQCPDTNETLRTGSYGGTVPKKSTFTCMEATCGKQWDILEAVKATQKTGPVAMYAIQGYCPRCDEAGEAYSGRFFATPDPTSYAAAHDEWDQRQIKDLADYWPKSELPFGFMTSLNNGGLPNHGFTHWWTMFNKRQLLAHAQILRALHPALSSHDSAVAEFVLAGWQHLVHYQCMFSHWQPSYDKMIPHFSNNNFHPKPNTVEGNIFATMGAGVFGTLREWLLSTLEWRQEPWELVACEGKEMSGSTVGSKSLKVLPHDGPDKPSLLTCTSSTDLAAIDDGMMDLVITDPPFGGLLHYSELSDFFHVWLRLLLASPYPDQFLPEYTPKALEAVTNRARHPDDADEFYRQVLTGCWRETARILKPAGILAFTFHHSEDEPWVAVLESLFQAGFYLEATYPIRSDETKGEGGKPGTFGSQLIEYDIIHVCRKRVDDPQEISWARLRRQILQDVQQLQLLLEHHQKAGLQQADLQVIRRGKALEYFSKHYGKVYIEKGREFTVREALAGINQLLDDQQDAKADVPPVDAEPYTRQFLRLFVDTTAVPRDQMQKYLRGTGISPTEFEERGWCKEVKKVFHLTSPLAFAQQWKGKPRQGMGRDFDQAYFLIGGCFENSGIRVHDTLNSEGFKPHVATGLILDWLARHGGDTQTRDAAKIARQIYSTWEASNDTKVKAAQKTFDFSEVD